MATQTEHDTLRSRRIQDALSKRRPHKHAPHAVSPVQACLDAAAAADGERHQLLVKRMEAVLSDERFADVVLVVDGRRFSCHRALLAASSDYFARMFDGRWAEAKAQEVQRDILRRIEAEEARRTAEYVKS